LWSPTGSAAMVKKRTSGSGPRPRPAPRSSRKLRRTNRQRSPDALVTRERDAAEQARAETAAARADAERTREVLQTVLNNMSDGIVLYDGDFRLRFINHQLVSLGYTHDAAASPDLSVHDLLHFGLTDDVEKIAKDWAAGVLQPRG